MHITVGCLSQMSYLRVVTLTVLQILTLMAKFYENFHMVRQMKEDGLLTVPTP